MAVPCRAEAEAEAQRVRWDRKRKVDSDVPSRILRASAQSLSVIVVVMPLFVRSVRRSTTAPATTSRVLEPQYPKRVNAEESVA